MKTIRLVIELTYDDEMIHADDPDGIAWFHDILAGDDLTLVSEEIGDTIGTVKVVCG